jgi:hypothetical protein
MVTVFVSDFFSTFFYCFKQISLVRIQFYLSWASEWVRMKTDYSQYTIYVHSSKKWVKLQLDYEEIYFACMFFFLKKTFDSQQTY